MFDESEATGRKGKIKVMYVKSEGEQTNSHRKKEDKRSGFSDKVKSTSSNSKGKQTKNFSSHEQNKPTTVYKKNKKRPQLSEQSQAWLNSFSDNNDNERESHYSPDTNEQEYAISSEQLRQQRKEEIKVYGENACQALFKHRPDAIVKAWFIESITPRFRNTLSYLASIKKGYNVVTKEELTKISGTEHHGGVCFAVKKRTRLNLTDYLNEAGKTDCILALEGVANPHNIGAIVRSAAHYGVKAIIHQDPNVLDSGAAVRTAEGGAEYIQPIDVEDFFDALAILQRAGYTLISTSSHQGKPLSKTKLPAKSVILIGQENDGLTDSTWEKGNLRISIDGTGNVESLNVSVATAIILSNWWQHNKN
ncbi:tRNA/rRNA methyltransferase [Thorsellia anophelis]|uniref:RNA methyltransferase, TrmH family n=1 Tax=Thorsellia anophelis DSM 18579 TaxID=1123402 RepID=A0A1I0CK26_9GAMM|nr:tRNA/rRNA methyltransferase [Thorsellia anophelis]SET19982.1 RNA methyltransferase, TrmH family [Thorsellia anophelis DSM 18579]